MPDQLPRILVFSNLEYFAERALLDLRMLIEELSDSQMLHAPAPAIGLRYLETDPSIRIILVFACPQPEDPHYTKLRLIQDIATRVRDGRPIVTVGPFEPHHLLRNGATHECTVEKLSDLVTLLFEQQRLASLTRRIFANRRR